MALRAIQSGTISFGLVSIPVKLFTAAASEQVRFNTLHEKCGGRLKQPMYCPTCDVQVERSATVRGYEFARDQYVRLSDEEFKALEADRDSSISITEFVPLSAVDLVQVERSYYLGPDKGGDKAYRLLAETMKKADKVAIGHWAARGKEQLVAIRAYKDGLIFHQLYYADEVRAFDEVDTGATFQFVDIERELAARLVEQLSVSAFDASKYKDSFRERATQAIEKKVAGQEVQFAPEAPRAQIIDLFEALKQSLASEASPSPKKAPKKAGEGEAEKRERAPARKKSSSA